MQAGPGPQRRNSSRTHFCASERVLPALIAIALTLIAALGNLTHEAWVPHHWCPMHGEFVDAAGGAAQLATKSPQAQLSGTVAIPAGGSAESEHDHCPFIAAHARGFGVPQGAPRIVFVAVRPDVTAAEKIAAAPRIAASYLLLRAPKTSPPFA